MPYSNYPNGFANGLLVRNLPVLSSYAGNVYWVDSGASIAQPLEKDITEMKAYIINGDDGSKSL